MATAFGIFEYQAVVFGSEDGSFVGSAVSLLEGRGRLPGLIGSTPVVRVHGDRLRLQADPRQLPMPQFWGYLLMFVPFALDYWQDKQRRCAHVAS